jgi:S1-C subfamily serine protease
MRKMRPTKLLTAAAMFVAMMAVGGLTVQMTNPEPGFAREANRIPALAAKTTDLAAGSLPASGTFAPVVKSVAPAVVSITAEKTVEAATQPSLPFFFGPGMQPGQQAPGPQKQRGSGSGVILSPDGFVVTNHHVIEGAERITVHLGDKREFKAELVGTDPQSDIALLRIPAEDLPTLALGNSESVEVGDIVLAIWNRTDGHDGHRWRDWPWRSRHRAL